MLDLIRSCQCANFGGRSLDRLLHRSTVINIRGDSYRLKEKRNSKTALVAQEDSSTLLEGVRSK